MKIINNFSDEFAFLSNFYSSGLIDLYGVEWITVEHAYQAAKTTNPLEKEMIRNATTPGRSKRLGQKVELRSDWEEVRLEVMETLVTAKFRQNPDLKDKLLATGDAELVEGNWWHDTFWGVCNGEGANHLGLILMKVRGQLKG